ncbi:4-hydroxyphenylpyruvate dioxygenase [Blastomyces silverae]|uniref:4-hydroxyphenylpyruvate dioxygenase n=1 Tax=Blastomyces silverae TaxID=2060906 RepID=A0A0H1BAH5_9EURO|nr:4-hydroxyphenylpyruvate dioxygenase [Blastomyces silverae]
MIQIPANFLGPDPGTGKPRTTGDLDVIVADLREVAERGLREDPPVRFAYEALAWSTHVDTWEACWEVVQRVDRANFGICLDTFNLAGRVYADPAVRGGKVVNADANLRASLARLVAAVDVRKVFYIQVVDAERLERPLVKGHEWHVSGQPSRMSWSRNARLFAFEEERGGYLPILAVARAFFDLGFEGWVSLELFSRSTADPKPDTPAAHARRGAESWRKLVRYLGLKADVSWHIVDRTEGV